MWRYVLAFETKLRLWECQLDKESCVHFPTLEESKPTSNTAFVTVIRNLRIDFSSRFSDIRSLQNKFRLFSTPFDVDVNTIPEKFQIDCIEMQCGDELKAKFYTKGISLLDFYKKYLLESGLCPSLTNNAKEMTSMFGSTYTCERLFSTMKFTKSKLGSCISDAHLENVLLLALSDYHQMLKNFHKASSIKCHINAGC